MLFLVAQDGIPAAMSTTDFLLECRCTQTTLVHQLMDVNEIIDTGGEVP